MPCQKWGYIKLSNNSILRWVVERMREVEKPANRYINKEYYNTPMSATELKQVMDELKTIKKELADIKEIIPNKDMFLTTDESVLLQESFENERKGRLISSKD